MPSKTSKKKGAAELPVIPKELIDQLVSGPMTAEAVNAASMASLLYTAGPTLLGKEAFDALLVAFQRAVKEKTEDALRELVLAASRLKWQELPEALGPLVQASPECLSAIATPASRPMRRS